MLKNKNPYKVWITKIHYFSLRRLNYKGNYIPDGTFVSILDGILRSSSFSHRVRAVSCGKCLPRRDDDWGAVLPQTALRLSGVWHVRRMKLAARVTLAMMLVTAAAKGETVPSCI